MTPEQKGLREERMVLRERERQRKRDAKNGYAPAHHPTPAEYLPKVRSSYERPGERPHGPKQTPPPYSYGNPYADGSPHGAVQQYHPYPYQTAPVPAGTKAPRKRLSNLGLLLVIVFTIVMGPSLIGLVFYGVNALIEGAVGLGETLGAAVSSLTTLISNIWIQAVSILGVAGSGFVGYRLLRARKQKKALNGSLKKKLGKGKDKSKSTDTDGESLEALPAVNRSRELKSFDGEIKPGPMSEDEKALLEMLEKNGGLVARQQELADVQQRQEQGIDQFEGLSPAEREVEEQKLAIKQSEEATLRQLRAKKEAESPERADGGAVSADAMYEEEMAELFAEFKMDDPTKGGSTVEYSLGDNNDTDTYADVEVEQPRKKKSRGIPKL